MHNNRQNRKTMIIPQTIIASTKSITVASLLITMIILFTIILIRNVHTVTSLMTWLNDWVGMFSLFSFFSTRWQFFSISCLKTPSVPSTLFPEAIFILALVHFDLSRAQTMYSIYAGLRIKTYIDLSTHGFWLVNVLISTVSVVCSVSVFTKA